jgi:hypothetical protein
MPRLKASANDSNLLEWTKPGVKGSTYTKLLVAQPLIFLSEKNKYKGFQPDQMKLFADRVGRVFVTKMSQSMEIVNKPGPGVLVLQMAITELSMKKKRSLLGYTPIGAIVHATQSQSEYEDLGKLAKKVLMKGAVLEMEALDGVSGERVAIRVLNVQGKKKGRDEESWQALRAEIEGLANRFYANYQTSLR